jgi:hypothetical protein
MSEEEAAHRSLTRALILGVSLGVLPLVTVGCMPITQESSLSGSEREQYAEALRTGDPRAVDAFLSTFPNSLYAPMLLDALSLQVLVRLSPTVVANLSPKTLSRLSPSVRAQLSASEPWLNGASADAQISPLGSHSARSGY